MRRSLPWVSVALRVAALLGASGGLVACGSSGSPIKLPSNFLACIHRASSLTLAASAHRAYEVKDRRTGTLVGKVEVFASTGAAAMGFDQVPHDRAFAEQLERYVIYTTASASDADSTALTGCAQAAFEGRQ